MTARKRSSDERSGGLYGVASVRPVQGDSAISGVTRRSPAGHPEVTRRSPEGHPKVTLSGSVLGLVLDTQNGPNGLIPPRRSIWRRGDAPEISHKWPQRAHSAAGGHMAPRGGMLGVGVWGRSGPTNVDVT